MRKLYFFQLQQKAGGDIWEETEQAPKPVLPSAVKKSVSIAKAPRFIVPLDGKMVDEGDRNVVLRCVIEGKLSTSRCCSFNENEA